MKKSWINFFLFLFFTAGIKAQEIQDRLYKAGFENIQVKEEVDSLMIFFEHREFRSPYHSIHYASLITKDLTAEPVVWVPLHHNTPIGKYSTRTFEFYNLSREERSFYRKNNAFQEAYRFHFRIHPDFSARFGYYSDPF